MTMTYTQLTIKLEQAEFALSEMRKELDELYDYSENLQDSNQIISLRNIRLETKDAISSRTIDNLESKLNKQIRLNKRVYQ